MKNKKLFSLAVACSIGLAATAQNQISKGLFIANSGNGPQTNVGIHQFDVDSITYQNNLGTDYVQDVLIDGRFAYVAATDSIFMYDLATKTQLQSAEFSGTSTGKLFIHDDYLFVGNQFGSDTVNLIAYNKISLNEEASFSDVNLPVSDMVSLGDTLYVIQNLKHTIDPPFPNFYNDSIGYLAKIDLTDLSYAGDVVFDASQTNNFERLFSYNNKLHILGHHEQGVGESKYYTYDPATATEMAISLNTTIDFSYGSQAEQSDSFLYFRTDAGVGLFNLSTESIEDSLVIASDLISFAVDWVEQEIYTANGDYWSSAEGKIFNFSGDSVGNYVPATGYAPEAMGIYYNHLPVANADFAWAIQGQAAVIMNLTNDTDADDDTPASMYILTNPENGTASDVFGASITYTSDIAFEGLDSLQYVFEDVYGDSDTAWVYIQVSPKYDLNIASFEEQNLNTSGIYNGSDLWRGFISGDARFYNSYNPAWGSWSGTAVSNHLDTLTAGWSNQYSSYAGDTIHGNQFAVFNGTSNKVRVNSNGEETVDGFYISNSSYAALSMKDGDMFAKKFGGATGDDADWFKVKITGWDANGNKIDSLDFYLADYRFADNTQDYILKDWTWVELNMENVLDLSFELSSSDVGTWGMNTPAYFCMDKLVGEESIGLTENEAFNLSVYPNPAFEEIHMDFETEQERMVSIIDYRGRVLKSQQFEAAQINMNLEELSTGIYQVLVVEGEKKYTSKVYKY